MDKVGYNFTLYKERKLKAKFVALSTESATRIMQLLEKNNPFLFTEKMQPVELYYDYLHDALSRGSVPELFTVWRDSLAFGSTGQEMRDLITSQLPQVGKVHGMLVEEGMSFQDFVAAHRTHLIDVRCRRGPKKTSIAYAKEGNWEAVFYILDKLYAQDPLEIETLLQDCVKIYSKQATVAQVEAFLERITKYKLEGLHLLDQVLAGAVKANNEALIEWCLKQPAIKPFGCNLALCAAIKTKQEKWIAFFLEKPLDSLCNAFRAAAAVDNKQLIEHILAMEENHDILIDYGLEGAVKGGHLDLVKMFLQMGAPLWWGFNAAARHGQLAIAEFLVEKGTVRWRQFVEEAAIENHVHMVEYFFKCAPTPKKEDIECLLDVALIFESYAVAAYLLEQGLAATSEEKEQIRLALL